MRRLTISFWKGMALAVALLTQSLHAQVESGRSPDPPNQPVSEILKTWDNRLLRRSKSYQRIKYAIVPPTKRDREVLLPLESDVLRYQRIWQNDQGGLIRIFDVSKCLSDKRILNVAEPCPSTSIPGRAAHFSFRTGSYESPDRADVLLRNGVLLFVGRNVLGFMTGLKAQDIEQAGLGSPGLTHLVEFSAPTRFEEVRSSYFSLIKGIKFENFTYGSAVKVRLGQLYAVRAIAYKNDLYFYRRGFKLSLFEGDKRDDVLAVFQVVRTHEDGSITIVWRELRRMPGIKFEAGPVAKE